MATSLQHPNTKETWDNDKAIFPGLQAITVSAGAFTASTAHSISSVDEIWIVKVIMTDGTNTYQTGSIYFSGTGIQGWRITSTNIESSKAGTLSWTGFTADVHFEYTLS